MTTKQSWTDRALAHWRPINIWWLGVAYITLLANLLVTVASLIEGDLFFLLSGTMTVLLLSILALDFVYKHRAREASAAAAAAEEEAIRRGEGWGSLD